MSNLDILFAIYVTTARVLVGLFSNNYTELLMSIMHYTIFNQLLIAPAMLYAFNNFNIICRNINLAKLIFLATPAAIHIYKNKMPDMMCINYMAINLISFLPYCHPLITGLCFVILVAQNIYHKPDTEENNPVFQSVQTTLLSMLLLATLSNSRPLRIQITDLTSKNALWIDTKHISSLLLHPLLNLIDYVIMPIMQIITLSHKFSNNKVISNLSKEICLLPIPAINLIFSKDYGASYQAFVETAHNDTCIEFSA